MLPQFEEMTVEIFQPDSLFFINIEERNGEQEYTQKIYIQAPTMPEAKRIAISIAENWYFDAKLGDLGWEINHGGVIWDMDGPYLITAAPIEIWTSHADTKQAWFSVEEILGKL